MSIKIAMIAGVAENGVIGSSQTIPWRIPSDFGFFKRTTMGKPMIMGRKQYETVGKPLPGRTNIVVTRQPGYQPEGVLVFSTIEAALEKARAIAVADGVDEVMIIGGGDIYAQLMNVADRLYISHIELNPEGDVLFPVISPEQWIVVDSPEIEPSPKDEARYRVNVYERR
ncbi:diacylglycerol kinase [Devosia epidermidihirudinis]|uniref:Dihydrofolate reductase n=1 Tax=Devosia epidermidihirudinis TaxID=1293439 RepID=A0A0F5Q3T6_9HYPH|nr:dihydrofolate reductase [Devosia epidermidihirudinis]KKC35578.1 diacylglycerol kinase [Devosia epidermidihirudinis]